MADAKVRVASHLILCSPPGQTADVERDVRTLLGSGLDTAQLESVYRTYNTAHHVPVPLQDGSVMLLTPDGVVDGGRYLDTHARRSFAVDHTTLSVLDAGADASQHFDAALEPLRAVVASAVREYVGAHYSGGGASATTAAAAASSAAAATAGALAAAAGVSSQRGSEVYSKGGALVIATFGLVKNVANFWAGEWRGRFVVGFPAGMVPGRAILTGTVRVTTHYYESANVQLHDDKVIAPVSLDYGPGEVESLGRAVVRGMALSEEALVDSVDALCEGISTSALKEMRRALPVSGRKMNWDSSEDSVVRAMAQQQQQQQHRKDVEGPAAPIFNDALHTPASWVDVPNP